MSRIDLTHKTIISGCGAVGSALPWGGRGRKFKSCHSDQEKHRKRSFSVLFSCFFTGIAYFFVKSALFQNRTTTFLTTATRTFDHYRPETSSKTAIFRCGQTNLKFTGLRSNFATSAALFLCFRHSNFSKFKRSERFSTYPTAFLVPLVHLSRLR